MKISGISLRKRLNQDGSTRRWWFEKNDNNFLVISCDDVDNRWNDVLARRFVSVCVVISFLIVLKRRKKQNRRRKKGKLANGELFRCFCRDEWTLIFQLKNKLTEISFTTPAIFENVRSWFIFQNFVKKHCQPDTSNWIRFNQLF